MPRKWSCRITDAERENCKNVELLTSYAITLPYQAEIGSSLPISVACRYIIEASEMLLRLLREIAAAGLRCVQSAGLRWRHNSSRLDDDAGGGFKSTCKSAADPPRVGDCCSTPGESGVIAAGTQGADAGQNGVSMWTVPVPLRRTHRHSTRSSNYPAVARLHCPNRPFAALTTHMLFIIRDKQPIAFCTLNEHCDQSRRDNRPYLLMCTVYWADSDSSHVIFISKLR